MNCNTCKGTKYVSGKCPDGMAGCLVYHRKSCPDCFIAEAKSRFPVKCKHVQVHTETYFENGKFLDVSEFGEHYDQVEVVEQMCADCGVVIKKVPVIRD